MRVTLSRISSLRALLPMPLEPIIGHAVLSALPPKADMCGATRDVRYGRKADLCGAAKRDRYSITRRQRITGETSYRPEPALRMALIQKAIASSKKEPRVSRGSVGVIGGEPVRFTTLVSLALRAKYSCGESPASGID